MGYERPFIFEKTSDAKPALENSKAVTKVNTKAVEAWYGKGPFSTSSLENFVPNALRNRPKKPASKGHRVILDLLQPFHISVRREDVPMAIIEGSSQE